jgi:hypothetical protein
MGDLRPVKSPTGRSMNLRQCVFLGCKPGLNCDGVDCQKQSFGIQFEGIWLRYTVVTFGLKMSGDVWDVLIAPLLRQWRRQYKQFERKNTLS